ncbi:hypothetical protein CRG98_023596 [Punica granatum]|uniref:Uncharacterized protein n=1 Tax=Punica granatum TaxID=22663 RepID=A0A2I0JIC2_PUNGR|nr:hypothetical protein CRG98_023596 [Punica granatum]
MSSSGRQVKWDLVPITFSALTRIRPTWKPFSPSVPPSPLSLSPLSSLAVSAKADIGGGLTPPITLSVLRSPPEIRPFCWNLQPGIPAPLSRFLCSAPCLDQRLLRYLIPHARSPNLVARAGFWSFSSFSLNEG